MKPDESRDRESLMEAARLGAPLKFLFFWGHQPLPGGEIGKTCLSQWWEAPFVVDDERYLSAEHFMMAEKARLFGDEEVRSRVLRAPNPGAAKRLGREVKSFD